jgi:hypothetical protein
MAPAKIFPWIFQPPGKPVTPGEVILWWEARRIPYNLIVFGYGIVAFIVFLVSLSTSGHLKPGEDAFEPLALLVAPFAVNFCYTLGWLVDAPLRLLFPSLTPRFTPLLFWMGLGFSLLLISIPAVGWGGYRLLQLLHLVS